MFSIDTAADRLLTPWCLIALLGAALALLSGPLMRRFGKTDSASAMKLRLLGTAILALGALLTVCLTR